MPSRSLYSFRLRSKGGNLHTLCLGDEVLVSQTGVLALGRGGAKSETLHSVVVECADSVEVGAGSEFLQLLLGVV